MGLLCRLLGHRWGISGITGKYEWCSRCTERRGRLTAHFARMQAMASAYLEPAPYRDLNGVVIPADCREARDRAFISDIIFSLDGPEQREAQK